MPTDDRSLPATELARVITAARGSRTTRACLLTARDREHALSIVTEVAVRTEQPLFHFTVARRRRYNANDVSWRDVGTDVANTVGLIRHAGEVREGIVVLEDCLLPLRDEGGDQQARTILADLLSTDSDSSWRLLVFLEAPEAASRLPGLLASRFARIDVPYPRADELTTIATAELAQTLQRTKRKVAIEKIRAHSEQLVAALVGLTQSAARDALQDALAPNPTDIAGAARVLEERKARLLERELAMEVLPAIDEDPIGLDYLVEYLRSVRDRARLTGPERARGVLLIGPPGTGKTMLARSIGRVMELPVIAFRISALMGSLLGQTERRFAQAFATIEVMAPNVILIDEIEKAFGDSSERDGGTMMRCTGALLSWLSDNPHPNYIIGTANSLRRMGEIGQTMTRSERFDAAYFCDVPSLTARRAMLNRWLTGRIDGTETVAAALAEETERFSGADLRSVVKQAAGLAQHDGEPLNIERLHDQVKRKRPRALALYDEFHELRRWGRLYCDPAGPTDS